MLLSLLCFIIVSYNVENLFSPQDSSEQHVNYSRYYKKVDNIARVLTNIGEWEGVDVVGVQEVENAEVVKRLCYTLRRREYDFVHYESPDRRGIDVALIYKKSRVDTIRTRALKVDLEFAINGGYETTRDILYVCTRVDKRDTIHFFVCHLPSQRGGKAETEWKRKIAKEVLQRAVDSVFTVQPNAKIVVMGDMNSEEIKLNGLTDKKTKGEGTHKYQGRWSFLDHFYVSPSLDSLSHARVYDAEWIMETDEKYLGLRPKRTYNGFTYQNGFSDHLPIILNIAL